MVGYGGKIYVVVCLLKNIYWLKFYFFWLNYFVKQFDGEYQFSFLVEFLNLRMYLFCVFSVVENVGCKVWWVCYGGVRCEFVS